MGCLVRSHLLSASDKLCSSWQIEEPLQFEFMKMDEMRNNPTEDMQSELLGLLTGQGPLHGSRSIRSDMSLLVGWLAVGHTSSTNPSLYHGLYL